MVTVGLLVGLISPTRTSVATSAVVARSTCTIRGTPGADVLVGTPGRDVICAGGGADTVNGMGGSDIIRGGGGSDSLHGNEGGDMLVAGIGRDSLSGGRGTDRLVTRDRQPFDRLDGGPGTDLCIADAEDHRTACAHPRVLSHRTAIPILEYHVIAIAPSTAPFPALWVPPREFAEEMRYLDSHGYHVISLQQAYDFWHGGDLPPRPIVVSFDDGYRSQYRSAMPILARHGWAGVLNLVVHNLRSHELGPRRVRTMISRDWEVDSHTLTHPDLTGLGSDALRAQVGRSRTLLRRAFRIPVNFFCYPSGRFDAAVISAVRRAGYLLATTTIAGVRTSIRARHAPQDPDLPRRRSRRPCSETEAVPRPRVARMKFHAPR